MYKELRNHENLEKGGFSPIDKYGNCEILPTYSIESISNWIPFNKASTQQDKENKGVHFFIDDYQFIRCWRNPDNYIKTLKSLNMFYHLILVYS